jgi:hypothetical protein
MRRLGDTSMTAPNAPFLQNGGSFGSRYPGLAPWAGMRLPRWGMGVGNAHDVMGRVVSMPEPDYPP